MVSTFKTDLFDSATIALIYKDESIVELLFIMVLPLFFTMNLMEKIEKMFHHSSSRPESLLVLMVVLHPPLSGSKL
jgi:hypothetical protein